MNDRDRLAVTLQSILAQKTECELIVIDGGSVDGTVDVLSQYKGSISYSLSEPDAGVYDAMNKGIRVASGEGLLFLNAGDYFVGDVLSQIQTAPCLLPVKYGNYFGQYGLSIVKWQKLGMPYCHQGIVFPKTGLMYDIRLRIAADYDYFLRHGFSSAPPMISCSGWVHYANDGISKLQYLRGEEETRQIIASRFGLPWALAFDVFVRCKRILKTIRHWVLNGFS